MAFTPAAPKCSGRIRTVTLGTGERAISIGGQSVMPLYTFDGPIENPPRIGVEISDLAGLWTTPGIAAFYAGCTTMADRARRAEAMPGADFLCLSFDGADPGGENRPVADCVADAVAVAEVTAMPLVISGCKNLEKDGALFAGIGEALRDRNILLLSARSENYQSVGPAAAACGQKLGAETADDINLAKQLNILLRGLNVPEDGIVMNVGTAAVGYGYDYVASTYDRVRLAALEQADTDLQMPIVSPVSADTWGVKESTASEADEPAWGSQEERGIAMEIATAAADLVGGADAVILRHPAAVAAIHRFIAELI